jgi:hypothetical protein
MACKKLRDDVIQPVDLALGHVEVLLQFLREISARRGAGNGANANFPPVVGEPGPAGQIASFFNSRSINCK